MNENTFIIVMAIIGLGAGLGVILIAMFAAIHGIGVQ